MSKFELNFRIGKLKFGRIEIVFYFPSARDWKFWRQRRTRGWDDSETWSLFTDISRFTLPRLKRFKELNIGHPAFMTEEEWDKTIDKMIYSFEMILAEEDGKLTEDETVGQIKNRDQKVQEGLKLFGKYFQNLWW